MNKKPSPNNSANHIAVFQETAIRRLRHNNEECWFSVIDVVGVLSESNDANRYCRLQKYRRAYGRTAA